MAKDEILQLPFDICDAEAVRQRGVNVQRLLSRAFLVRLGHGRQRAHVVEPVTELYEQDSRVFGHGHEHLAHRRRLGRRPRVERDPLQLGDTVHDLGHHRAKVSLEVGHRQGGVLHRVVQQGGGQRDVVHAEAGQHRGHRQRMRDERFSGPADLALMSALGRLVRLQDQALVALGMALPVRLQQRSRCLRLRLALPPPGQDALNRSGGLASGYPFDCAHFVPFTCP